MLEKKQKKNKIGVISQSSIVLRNLNQFKRKLTTV